MTKLKFWAVFQVVILLTLIIGSVLTVLSSIEPANNFVPVTQVVAPGLINQKCEGQPQAIPADAQSQEKTLLAVTCNEAQLQLTFAASLVGTPLSGYAAQAELVSPRRNLVYSQWMYTDSAQAAAAKARWRNYFQAEGKSTFNATEQAGALNLNGQDEFGMPWWGRVAQNGNRLVITKVEALPKSSNPPTSVSEMEQWFKNLKPENEASTQAFFEESVHRIEHKFLGR